MRARGFSASAIWRRISTAVGMTNHLRQGPRLRILVCSNLFPPDVLGGAELVAYRHAKVLQEWGHDVRIFCGRIGDAETARYQIRVEKDEFHITRVSLSPRDMSGDLWPYDNRRITQAFTNTLEKSSPDVVHVRNLVGLSVKMIDECFKRGIPTVLTLHDHWGICFKSIMTKNDGRVCTQGGFDCLDCKETLTEDLAIPSPVRNAHILLSLLKADRLIAPSAYLAERYVAHGIPRERMTVLKNGINLAHFQGLRPEHEVFTLGFIGFLGKHKGLDVLLRALGLLGDLDQVRLLVVGDGDQMDHLKALCLDLHLTHVVTFAGHVDHPSIAAMYAQLDVLVVPSVCPENHPSVIGEAMASGLPVIASDIGGIRELVDAGVTGFLVPPTDSRALADTIERLRADPNLRRAMGEKARGNIQQYDLRIQVAHMLQIFWELHARRKGQRARDLHMLLYAADAHGGTYLREILHRLAALEQRLEKRLLVCRMDLSDEETLRSGELLLLPTAGQEALSQALHAFQRQIPIVVSEHVRQLKGLCLASNAGLFYQDLQELQECLHLLLSNEPLRQAMGMNGRNFVQSFRRATTMP